MRSAGGSRVAKGGGSKRGTPGARLPVPGGPASYEPWRPVARAYSTSDAPLRIVHGRAHEVLRDRRLEERFAAGITPKLRELPLYHMRTGQHFRNWFAGRDNALIQR